MANGKWTEQKEEHCENYTKSTSPQEWIQNYENLLWKLPIVTHEPITRIIIKQLVIKLGPLTQEELDSVLKKLNIEKQQGLKKNSKEVWKTRQCDDILLRH